MLGPYERSNLKYYNGTLTDLYGYMKLMVTLGEGKDTRMVDSQLLVVSFKSVYSCIMHRLFTTTLDVVASPVYHKLKYHNV